MLLHQLQIDEFALLGEGKRVRNRVARWTQRQQIGCLRLPFAGAHRPDVMSVDDARSDLFDELWEPRVGFRVTASPRRLDRIDQASAIGGP